MLVHVKTQFGHAHHINLLKRADSTRMPCDPVHIVSVTSHSRHKRELFRDPFWLFVYFDLMSHRG